MNHTIDDCQNFIISTLLQGLNNNKLNSTILSRADCPIEFNAVVGEYLKLIGELDPDLPGSCVNINYQDQNSIRQNKINLQNLFLDALWHLCRMGILRPGVIYGTSFTSDGRSSESYSITTYGETWLKVMRIILIYQLIKIEWNNCTLTFKRGLVTTI